MFPFRSTLLLDDFGVLKDLLFKNRDDQIPALTDSERSALEPGALLESLVEQRPARSAWMNDDEPLLRIIEGWEHTLRNGKVVWGSIVKANHQLWQIGTEDCPALLAWSPDQEFASLASLPCSAERLS